MKEALHREVLELQMEGELERLEKLWWRDMGRCWNVTRIENHLSTAFNLNRPKTVRDGWNVLTD